MDESGSREPLITRRAVTRAAAWSVPAIAVAAAVPAYAASGQTITITGVCGSGNTATANVQVVNGTPGDTVTVTFQRVGDGGLSTTTPPGWTLGPITANTRTYTASIPASGSIISTFNLGFTGLNGNDSSTVTITGVFSAGLTAGKPTASIRKSIQGQTYSCTVLS